MSLDYHSPLASRYCSTYIRALFSEKKRAQVFRQLWVILAQIEKKLGLPIEQKAIDQMLLYVDDIDLDEINVFPDKGWWVWEWIIFIIIWE